ncbi:MAG: hypothetical protein GX161_15210, partial [Firmicutes bacterium]|nr:hypothetical protein [Bacillota bacterium]
KLGPNVGYARTMSITLYWFPLHYVAHGQTQDVSFRENYFNIKMSGTRSDGIDSGDWVDLRIVVHSEIQLHIRPDGGEWSMIARIKRPENMMTPPAEIVVGKGFENAAELNQPNLQNSDPEAGLVGTALFDYVRLIIDGTEIFNDTFESLDAWKTRIDPEYASEIELSVVSL